MTDHQVDSMQNYATLHLTNYLMVAVTSGDWDGSNNATTSSSSVFLTAGAGAHYLNDNTYRDSGTASIDSGLLNERNRPVEPSYAEGGGRDRMAG